MWFPDGLENTPFKENYLCIEDVQGMWIGHTCFNQHSTIWSQCIAYVMNNHLGKIWERNVKYEIMIKSLLSYLQELQ